MNPMAPFFESFPDRRCLRGLHVVYRYVGVLNDEVLKNELHAATSGHLIEAAELWGERRVTRLVLQFRFEVRVGARDNELSLCHRSMAQPAQRLISVQIFERALEAALRPAAGAAT